jgi:hypothetical protein
MSRPLSTIAQEIQDDWAKPYFGAVPYLAALGRLNKVTDEYGRENGRDIILFFLSNAGT